MNESGDTGFKELETIGMVSRASEGDVQRGLIEIIEIIKQEGKIQPPQKRKKREEDFQGDQDEFDEIEEENYLEGVLEQKKLEDDNLEVFLIEAHEVNDEQMDDEEF